MTKSKKKEHWGSVILPLNYKSKPQLEYYQKYQPHKEQLPFHKSLEKIRAMIAGARGGKTLSSAAEFASFALFQSGYFRKDFEDKKPYVMMAAAPTYKMLDRIVVPEVLRMLPACVRIGKYNESKRRLRIKGKYGVTEIYFISAQKGKKGQGAENIEGMQLYVAWLDEFLQIPESFYNETKTRLSDRLGHLLLSGTPKGRNWAYHNIYLKGFIKDSGVFVRHFKTIDNPYFPKQELIRARKTLPKAYFKRTYEANFDVFEGQIYDEFSRDTHVIPEVPKGERIHKIFAGHDFGYTAPAATIWFGVTKEKVYALDEIYKTHVLVDKWGTLVKEKEGLLRKKYGLPVDRYWCDNDPERIKRLKRSGVRNARAVRKVRGSNDESFVSDGIQLVSEKLHINLETEEPLYYILADCENLIAEKEGYHWKIDAQEKEMEVPEKENDHGQDAERYAFVSELERIQKSAF